VAESHSRQAPAPLQNPSVPQVDCAVIAHSASGSVPPVTARQRPLGWPVLPIEQAWQTPPQADSQQTPSTQLPLVHSLPSPQAEPFACCPTHAAFRQ
jgi:hypothetical protein